MIVEPPTHPAPADPTSLLTSTELAISVRGVGKMYRIYDHPQDRLKQMLFWRFGKSYGREFWALRDVSFDVKKGETVGIIGRNGSGKSTLLQIIAGTLAPTEGEVEVHGRVAALLELGSGFNPEFTGRENVYMNGAILGLSHEEMEARFDDIAAFADIGEFLEQPVKTYSSGMMVRLAFAVQACVEPDILIVDEALAVGDIFFRQKCYRRLEALRQHGTSILLVSHAMVEIEQFCDWAMLLNSSRVLFSGAAAEAVKRYYLIEQQRQPDSSQLSSTTEPGTAANHADSHSISSQTHFWPAPDALVDISRAAQVTEGSARCTAVAICDKAGRPSRIFRQGETASFFYEFELLRDIDVPVTGIVLQNDRGILVHGKNTLQYGSAVPMAVPSGRHLRLRQDITLNLMVGEYTFEVGLSTMSRYDYLRREQYAHGELYATHRRLCHVPRVATFTIVFRERGLLTDLMHHGVADLPGDCQVFVMPDD